MPIEKNKQKSFSLAEKIKILKCLNEPGMTRKKVREKYDLGESTLRGFIKNTKKLFETFNSSSLESAKRKRQRDGEYPELEDAVTLWISSSSGGKKHTEKNKIQMLTLLKL